jgi:hypothetical protein
MEPTNGTEQGSPEERHPGSGIGFGLIVGVVAGILVLAAIVWLLVFAGSVAFLPGLRTALLP